jgi:hypothetical protein
MGLSLDLSHAELGGDLAAGGALLRYFGEISGAYLVAFKEAGLRLSQQAAAAMRHCALVRVGEIQPQAELAWGGWSLPIQKAKQSFISSL